MTHMVLLSRYGGAILLLAFFGGLQAAAVSLYGIVPNLVLGAIVALLFYFSSAVELAVFSAAAAFLLNWDQGFPQELLALLLAVAAAFFVKKFLPWHFLIDTAALSALSFTLFVAFADPWYAVSFPARVAVEFLYAEAAAYAALGLLALWYGTPQEAQGA
ncbi:MAG: hypothetical protein HYT14_01725 [Candidatus Liptonbacteria bacterium]|nr:hypothetical protein [Candidatus Liptonbacteria bacterium]